MSIERFFNIKFILLAVSKVMISHRYLRSRHSVPGRQQGKDFEHYRTLNHLLLSVVPLISGLSGMQKQELS